MSQKMRRTRSIVFVVAICVLSLARITICDVGTENGKSIGNEKAKKSDEIVSGTKIDDPNDKNKSTPLAPATKTGGENITSQPKKPALHNKTAVPDDAPATSKPPEVVHSTSLNSGALLRGFYVFVGLTTLALAYMVFRSFRLNKSRTQMVRKYGVLAHKQDMEMRPLPLDEDDEDDTTVFDATGLAPPRPQS